MFSEIVSTSGYRHEPPLGLKRSEACVKTLLKLQPGGCDKYGRKLQQETSHCC